MGIYPNPKLEVTLTLMGSNPDPNLKVTLILMGSYPNPNLSIVNARYNFWYGRRLSDE